MPENKLRVILQAETSKFTNSLNKANKQLGGFSQRLTSVGKDLSLKLTLPIAAAGGAAIKLASDFEESLNKVDVSFKQSSAEVKEFTKTTLTQFGIAQGTALDMAAMFGDMGTSMGLTTQEAAKMSTSMVGLAGDLASFKNIKIEEATTALAAVFTGETESLKRLGIVMTEANLKQFALSQGIQTNIKDMTQAEKTTLRYQFVMASTANAQGDFARTQDGAANQMRIFTESLKELGADIGAVILPAFTELVNKANGIIQGFIGLSDSTKKTIVVIAGIAAAIGPLLIGLGAIIKLAPLVGAGFTLMTGPIGLFVAAIAGIGVIIYKNWDIIGPFVTDVYNGFVDLYNSSEQLRGVIGALGGVFKSVFTIIRAQIKAAINTFGSLSKVIRAVLKGDFSAIGGIIKEAFSNTVDIYKETGSEIADNVAKGFTKGIANKLEKKSTSEISKGLQNAFNTAATTVEVPTLGGGETRKPVANSTTTNGITEPGTTFASTFDNVDAFREEIQNLYSEPIYIDPLDIDLEELEENFDVAIGKITQKQQEMIGLAQQFSEQLAPIFEAGLEKIATGIGEVLGEAMASGGNVVQGLAQVLLGGIGNMATQLGQLAIGTGIAIEGIKEALKSLNPVVAIAAGIALVALGSFVKAKAASIGKGGKGGGGVPAFANGGIVSGPTLGLMGEYTGAKSNPEVIAPLDKLQNIIGDRQPQQVNVGGEFRLQGQDLVVALQRADRNRGRLK
jgi:hypothetical protein